MAIEHLNLFLPLNRPNMKGYTPLICKCIVTDTGTVLIPMSRVETESSVVLSKYKQSYSVEFLNCALYFFVFELSYESSLCKVS